MHPKWVFRSGSQEGHKPKRILPKRTRTHARFNYIRLIVAVGWTIYPLGFAIAYIIPGTLIRPHEEGPPYNPLNVLYNLADLVNKGAFGLAIWSAAVYDRRGDDY